MSYDGQLVSELGVKKYLLGHEAKDTANIPIMKRQAFYDKQWDKCNFGCHVPTYRRVKADASFSQFIGEINKISPVTAGLLDGAHASTIKQVETIGVGASRTAEGLGLTGQDNFRLVGDENLVALHLITSIFQKVIDTEIDFVDNPLTKLIMAIVFEYIGLVPESLLEKLVEDGALVIPDGVDEGFIYNLVAKSTVAVLDKTDISAASGVLQDPAKKIIAKQLGKKLGLAIAAILAAKITKKLMNSPDATWRFKKKIASFRKTARGGAAGVLVGLLKAQGWLGIAARESRSLHASCPKLWQHLRFKLEGADLLYFIVKEITKEYVDRLSLIEKTPDVYLQLMQSLIEEGKGKEIFFPN